ncbi:hypothetical protein [Pontixanthobacter sp.]
MNSLLFGGARHPHHDGSIDPDYGPSRRDNGDDGSILQSHDAQIANK